MSARDRDGRPTVDWPAVVIAALVVLSTVAIAYDASLARARHEALRDAIEAHERAGCDLEAVTDVMEEVWGR